MMAMATDPDLARGMFLLGQIQGVQSELAAAPESEIKAQQVAKLADIERRIQLVFVSTPHRRAFYLFFGLAKGGKLEFPDMTQADGFRLVSRLIDRNGSPDELKVELTDETVVDLIEAAVSDGMAWDYTKTLCANELLSGRELHPLLLKFVGVALLVTSPKKAVGRSGLKNKARNRVLAMAARLLRPGFDLPFSRGVASKADSVCSVLSETMMIFGLHMTEDAIRKAIEKSEADLAMDGKNLEGFVSGDLLRL